MLHKIREIGRVHSVMGNGSAVWLIVCFDWPIQALSLINSFWQAVLTLPISPVIVAHATRRRPFLAVADTGFFRPHPNRFLGGAISAQYIRYDRHTILL